MDIVLSNPEFKKIPKFTSNGKYSVSIALVDFVYTIDRYIKSYNLIIEPDFQRTHVWTLEQRMAYVEFLLRGGTSSRELLFNHPGWMGNFEGEFVLVDGLQRLTSLLMFMNNQLKVFGYYFNEFEDKLNSVHYDLTFTINNLKTKKDVLTWYLELNSGGTPHSNEELNKVKNLLLKEIK